VFRLKKDVLRKANRLVLDIARKPIGIVKRSIERVSGFDSRLKNQLNQDFIYIHPLPTESRFLYLQSVSKSIRVMADLIKLVEQEFQKVRETLPSFGPGDTINVHVKIKEGTKERVQQFQGTVIQRRGEGNGETFTVRKVSNGVGVERIFPIVSPSIDKIEVLKQGKVRRAKLYYMKGRQGKSARIKEKL
jgi:large subunit ribosomal protein L19